MSNSRPIPIVNNKQKRKLLITVGFIILLTLLFIPIPYIQTNDVWCLPCPPDTPPNKCPRCPRKGDITWGSSLAQRLYRLLINQESDMLTEPVLKTPATTPEYNIESTSNWKTYRSEGFGFEMRYPPDWTLIEVSWDGGPSETSVDYDGINLKPLSSSRGNTWINVYSVRNDGLTIKDYFNKNDYRCCGINAGPTYLGDRIMSSEKITVDNIEGRKLLKAPEDIPISGVTANWVVLERNRKIYLISYIKDENETTLDIEKIFDQILSSFQFLDQTTFDQTVSWEDYVSPNLGFSLKYPNYMKLVERDNVVYLTFWGPTQKANTEFYDGISLSFSNGLLENRSLKEYVDLQAQPSMTGAEILTPPTITVINGISGYSYRVRGAGDFTKIYLPFRNNGYFQIIDGSTDPTEKGFQKTVSEILSSFRFLN